MQAVKHNDNDGDNMDSSSGDEEDGDEEDSDDRFYGGDEEPDDRTGRTRRMVDLLR